MNAFADRHNRILKGLSSDEWERLLPRLEHITLSFKEPLFDQGSSIDAIYLINTGVVSIVTDFNRGDTVETATVGREGFVGIPAVLGGRVAPWRAFAQIPGDAFRLPVDELENELVNGGALKRGLFAYVNAALALLAQSAACNRAHTLEERMARWLLMTHDRVEGDEFPLTQEFLSQMLGVRRPTVSLAGGVFQRSGLIRYTRGRIRVLDRTALEAAACECYAVVQHRFDMAFGDAPAPSRRPRSRRPTDRK